MALVSRAGAVLRGWPVAAVYRVSSKASYRVGAARRAASPQAVGPGVWCACGLIIRKRRCLGGPPSRKRSRQCLEAGLIRIRRLAGSDLPVDLPHDVRPPVHDRQHCVRLLGREHRHYARDAHVCETLHPVKILAEAEQGDLNGGRIATGLSRHLVEFRQDLGDVATGCWNPAIAIADRAPRTIREGAADMDRRMRFLYRFGPGNHRIEIDELPMVCGLGFRPDFLHRLNGFSHPLEAAGVDGPMVFHCVLVPASTDAKQEPSLAHLVDRGDQLGGLDRVALLHEQHAGVAFDGLGNLARGSQYHERVHRIVVLFGQIAPSRKGRLTRQRDVRVLRRPNRLKTALFERAGKIHGRHRIICKEHRATEMHDTLPCYSQIWRAEVSCWRRPALSVTDPATRGSREPQPRLADDREGPWGWKSAGKDFQLRRAGRAKSSISTWMRSTPLSNSAILRICVGSRSRSADRGNAVSLLRQAMKRGNSACTPRCRRSRPSENAPS